MPKGEVPRLSGDRELILANPQVAASRAGSGVQWLAVSQRSLPGGQLRVDAVLPSGTDLAATSSSGAKDLWYAVSGTVLSTPKVAGLTASPTRGTSPLATQQIRIFFCGDAMGTLSPFGGLGGNAGVEDAVNLAWKMALVLLSGAPPALLYTFQAERGRHRKESEGRESAAEEILAPSSAAASETQRGALALLSAGQPLGLALIGPCLPGANLGSSVASSRLVAAEQGFLGASFQGAPAPGEAFVDCAVEVLTMEDVPGEKSSGGAAGRAARRALAAPQPPEGIWSRRSRLQLTIELLRKVIIVLDSSGFERMSDAHVEAAGRARRIGATLLGDRGGAVQSYDARPGSAVLFRPDLLLAARWRQVSAAALQETFLRATGTSGDSGSPALGAEMRLSASGYAALVPAIAKGLGACPESQRGALLAAAFLLLATRGGDGFLWSFPGSCLPRDSNIP
eukprot:s1544_g1.t1